MARQSTLSESQMASAAAHLSRFDQWRYYRAAGVRYIAMPSSTGRGVHQVRADGAGCSCPAYQLRGYAICSHMQAARSAATVAWERVQAPKPRPSYADIYPLCQTASCHEIAERGSWCDKCASDREFAARRESNRAAVAAR